MRRNRHTGLDESFIRLIFVTIARLLFGIPGPMSLNVRVCVLTNQVTVSSHSHLALLRVFVETSFHRASKAY